MSEGYRVRGTFEAVVPYACTAADAEETVLDGLNIAGSVHGQQIVKVNIDVVEEKP